MNTNAAITTAMAKAFFACAWAEQAEEAEESLIGMEIMDVLPSAIDPAASHAAMTLVAGIEQATGMKIDEVYQSFPGDLTPNDWGHYAAMSAIGDGVGLWEYVPTEKLRIPYVEFGSHSLEKDYF